MDGNASKLPVDDVKTVGAYVVFISIGYSIASSSLSIINKWALLEFPFAACLTALQFLVSAATVIIAARIFKVIECEPLQWAKVRAFFPAVLLFYFSIFCNTKLLQHATVDTFIVFRSCTPLFVLPLETLVLRTKTGENGPSTKTYLSLLFIAASSVCYVFVERGGITLTSYFWGAVYLVAIVVDMVVVKKVVTDVKLSSWGLVYYNNILALALFPVGYLLTSEGGSGVGLQDSMHAIFERLVNAQALLPVVISCVFGLGISFFAMSCRKALSATTFTVLGVICKIGTIVINATVWKHHASPAGIFFLTLCVLGGILYQQSLKSKPSASSTSGTKTVVTIAPSKPAA